MPPEPEMRVVGVAPGGGSGALHIATAPRPSCDGGSLRVRVRAAALNHADLYQRDGSWPAPEDAPDTLGVEVAGIVETADAGGRFGSGDAVMGLVAGGGYAEYACLDPGLAAPVPPGMSFAEAVSLPEAILVGHGNLVELGGLQPGERVLIQGGASGMGSIGLQMAALLGARVATTTGDMSKAGHLADLGAEAVFDRHSDDLPTALRLWAGGGLDLIVDIAGADSLSTHIDLLADRGRLILMGVMSGTIVDGLDIDPILLKRLRIMGTVLRPTPLSEKRELARAAFARWLPELRSGRLRPVLHAVHPMQDVRLAHDQLEAGRHVGKIVLDINGASEVPGADAKRLAS
ncbi:MAG: NAD(P)H-quinone oxidoreductase [Rhodobacter sp.]|nr:NAD(P)H-quinone oxidoreductase [Rhodobacter sp.]